MIVQYLVLKIFQKLFLYMNVYIYMYVRVCVVEVTEGERDKETVYVQCGLISGGRDPREGFHTGKAHAK